MEWNYGGEHGVLFNESWFVRDQYGVASLKETSYYVSIFMNEMKRAYLLSNYLRYGGDNFRNPPQDCQFATKEEAMAICERHYQLMVLQ